MSDLGLFMKQLIRRPHEVVALAPSSGDLARGMAAHLGPRTGRVVELGGGTGKLTRAILGQGIAPRDLTVFEMNPDFCEYLRLRFPDVTVHCAGAETASGTVDHGVGAVISGLPLLSMPLEVQRRIVGGAFRLLSPGAAFTQFTYGPRPPVAAPLVEELGLTVERGEKIWANLPPARIWHYRSMQRYAD